MTSDEVLATLLELERRGWDALSEGRGATFYGELMTDDGLMVLANGMVMDRDAVVESLKHAPPWSSYEISDVRLVDTGGDSAALVYAASASREDADSAFDALMSSVYVRRGDTWRLALYQQTPTASSVGRPDTSS